MTFTYSEDLSVERDFVRFHTGDVVQGQAFLSDEIIASLIAQEGSREAAVIGGLKHIISRLNQPTFRADWLQVSYKDAADGYRAMLREKQREFGLNAITASSVATYRADSGQTESPDYSNGRGPGRGYDEDEYDFRNW